MDEKLEVMMFEAGNGDCFLVRCSGEMSTNILIDFGYSNTYKTYLEKSLKEISTKGEVINLAIVTHIDQDHISGGIRFFDENGCYNNPRIIRVNEVWHNSYRHLSMKETEKKLTEKEKNFISQKSIVKEQNRNSEVNDTSGKQGSRLAASINYYSYNWNGSFEGRAVAYQKEAIHLNNEVKIRILSPTVVELEKLKKLWKKELRMKFPGLKLSDEDIFDDAVECISLMKRPKAIGYYNKDTSSSRNLKTLANILSIEDTDEINSSSITFIIEFNNKRVLFLGDSNSTITIKQLKKLFKEEEYPLFFDAIKISHHGSAKNTNNELLNLIDSKKYFISTNGNIHGHPDVQTIAKIVTRENTGEYRKIYFTNQLPKLKVLENEVWKKEFQYEIHYRRPEDGYISIIL